MRKAQWIHVGPTKKPYCEIMTGDSGLVYVSVQSGEVRTSDYLDPIDAARVGQALIDAAARVAAARLDEPPPECNNPALCRLSRCCADGCQDEPADDNRYTD